MTEQNYPIMSKYSPRAGISTYANALLMWKYLQVKGNEIPFKPYPFQQGIIDAFLDRHVNPSSSHQDTNPEIQDI